MSVRVRFAPSPTGHLHIGGLRTALYNYLFAKQHNGKFILRIEDTDKKRKVYGAEKKLIHSLQWSGVQYDEGPGIKTKHGPYRQSERLNIYKKYIIKLIKNGNAYPCFYNKKRLDKIKQKNIPSNIITEYDRQFRNGKVSELLEKMKKENYVIRLKVPLKGGVEYNDLARGKSVFNLSLIEDQILIKSDGYPTYHFANVVDDHLMEISHVIRGEEWMSSMPKHLLLYKFFKWNPPQFIHLPLILNKDKTKLSKRQNDVSIEDYINNGYLKESIINYLSLLGWHSSGNREIYSVQELIREFSIERIQKSGAVFDINKLKWMNNYYIKKTDLNQLKEKAKNFIPSNWNVNNEMLSLVSDKLEKLSDLKDELSIFFEYSIKEDRCYDIIKQNSSQSVLKQLIKHIKVAEEWNKKAFKDMVKQIEKETNLKGKSIWMPIRIAITGQMNGPDIGSIVQILGQKVSKQRILNNLNA